MGEEKNVKKRQRETTQQATGKFAMSEIVVLIDSNLFRNDANWMLVQSLQDLSYTVQEYPSAILGAYHCSCNAIQWIRKDYLLGGANDALQQLRNGNLSGYQLLDRLVIAFDDPAQFIKLLQREE